MSEADGIGDNFDRFGMDLMVSGRFEVCIGAGKTGAGGPGDSWAAREAVLGSLGNSRLPQDGTGSVLEAFWTVLEVYWDDWGRSWRRLGGP